MDGKTIQEFDMEGKAKEEEHGNQLAAEANARKFFVGKIASEVLLPTSVGDEAQRPVTGALQEALKQLQRDL